MRLLELVEAIQELREGRAVLRSFGTREAYQAEQQIACLRILGPGRDAGQEPGPRIRRHAICCLSLIHI